MESTIVAFYPSFFTIHTNERGLTMFNYEDVRHAIPRVITDWVTLSEPSVFRDMFMEFDLYYNYHLIDFAFIFSAITLLFIFITIQRFRKMKRLYVGLLVVCTLFSAVIAANSLFYGIIQKETKQVFENPDYEPFLLDKSTVYYPVDAIKGVDTDFLYPLERLSKEEWEEIRHSNISKETTLRLLLTIPLEDKVNESAYVEYLHFYDLYANENPLYSNMEPIPKDVVAQHAWYKDMLSNIELSLHQQSLMKPPAEEFTAIHKAKLDLERKYYELFQKEANISELFLGQKEGRVTKKEVQKAISEYQAYSKTEIPVIEAYKEEYNGLLDKLTTFIRNEADQFFNKTDKESNGHL